MVASDRVFVHFDKLCQFMVGQLYSCKADSLAWAVVMSHLHKLPQFQYRCDINQFIPLDIAGLEYTAKALKTSIDSISHLILQPAPGVIALSPQAKKSLAHVGETDPVIIIRTNHITTTEAPATAPKRKGTKKEWGYANALFHGPNKAFYDFDAGNKVMKMAKKEFKDMKDFCLWREEKSRPALPTNMAEVRKEYERFKTPPINLDAMKPVDKPEKPVYRKVNLKTEANND